VNNAESVSSKLKMELKWFDCRIIKTNLDEMSKAKKCILGGGIFVILFCFMIGAFFGE
jgi:hypothetical protein